MSWMNLLLNAAVAGIAGLALGLACLVSYIILHRLVHNWTDRATARRRGRYEQATGSLVAGEIGADSFVQGVAPGDRLLVETLLLEYAGKFSGEVLEMLAEAFAGIGAVVRNRLRTRSRFWWVRADASSRLGRMGSAGSDLVLRPLVRDRHIEVRIAAARALVKLGSQEFLDDLVRSLGESGGANGLRVADVILEAGPAAIPTLIRFVQTAADRPGVALALDILGDMRAVESAAVIGEALSAPSQEVRAAACRALGRLETPGAVPLLCGALQDPAPDVRGEALQALGRIGDPGALPFVRPLLTHSSPWSVYNAATALAYMGPEGIGTLAQALATNADAPGATSVARAIIREVLFLQQKDGGL